MTLPIVRPAAQVVINALDCADGRSLWIRERKYQACIREHSLSVHGKPLSTRALKRELNSLIHKGYVARTLWSPTGEQDEHGREVLTRIDRDDYRDFYTSLQERWQYKLIVNASDLLPESEHIRTPYFVS